MLTHLSPLNGKHIKLQSSSITNHLLHYCKKTGCDFETAKTIFFDSLPKKYCEKCGSVCDLISNLEYICSSRICRQRNGTPKNYKESKRFFGESAEKYIEFILQNLDFYLTNSKSKVPDPYDGLGGNFTLECKMKRRLPAWKDEPRFQKTVSCISCLEPRSVNIFSSYTDACSKRCAALGDSRNIHRNFIKLFEVAFGDLDKMKELHASGYKIDKFVIRCAKDMGLSDIKIYQLDLMSKPDSEIVSIKDKVFVRVPGKYEKVRLSRQSELMGIPNILERICLICGDKFIPHKRNSRFCSHECYHKSLSCDNFSKYHSVETRAEGNLRHSELMKKKIANGEFTPKITNSWCRNKTLYEIDGQECRFRSSWEAVFFLFNQHLQYEKHRIAYIAPDGVSHNYITDFTDETTRTIYEIKPNGLLDDPIVTAKRVAAEQWCLENGYTYVEISNAWFEQVCSDQDNKNKIAEYLGYNVKSMKQFF